ncbi:MAG: hypothetical protein ACYDCQ_16015 [Dehalococcoidia bacterium]
MVEPEKRKPAARSGTVAAIILVATAMLLAAAGSADGYAQQFCYGVVLAPHGKSGDHCYSAKNRSDVQQAEAYSHGSHAWVWVWNKVAGAASNACYSGGCGALAEVSRAGTGEAELATLSGFYDTFYGNIYGP